MTQIQIYLLGYGKVGKAFVEEVNSFNNDHEDIDVFWVGIENSKGLLTEVEGRRSKVEKPSIDNLQSPICNQIFLDLTASNNTTSRLLEAQKEGYKLILANKNPLVESQEIFRQFMSEPIGFRATVGAGLPVIQAIREIIKEGDEVLGIQACLSGTMGILCSELEKGNNFSEIIQDTYEKGFTEPDPRIDLAGGDVAKKLLIVSRLSAYQLELSEVYTETLFPPPLMDLEIADFLTQLRFLDPIMKVRVEEAQGKGQCLRYIASLDKGRCRVELKSVPKDSPLGQLKNDDKKILIQTKNNKEPIIIRGAGSGPKDTAKDLLKDLIDII